jgi:hypothetical protein
MNFCNKVQSVKKIKGFFMKRLFIGIVALLAMTTIDMSAAEITGKLIDASDSSLLSEATVKLVKASRDSAFVQGVTTNMAGEFTISDVPVGRYVVKLSYVGYNNASVRVSVVAGGRDVKLETVKLKPNTVILKEAVVVGVKSPITVKEDTIEYNAGSYKVQTNAVVEDLLKRLPGVEVSSDGKITANGKSVTKILLDGKEFFADDPTVASKNIPVTMVDKLQVIDRKSDLARLTGVDDGEDETVINLTVKKGMNNGWFGNVSGGYGTDHRYQGNAMINYFSNGNQFTILGGGNNVNNMGNTDGGASRFMRFGGNSGITKSQNAGINFNIGNEDKFRVGGSVMYSHSDRDTRQSADRQYLFTDSSSYYNSLSKSLDKGNNVRGDFRLKWEIDSANTIEFRPNFSLNFSNSDKSDTSMTRAGNAALTPVNKSLSYYYNDGKSYEFAGELVYNHKFTSHPGRSFSTQIRYNYSNVHEDGNTYTQNEYYLKGDSTQTIDQIYNNHRWTNGVNGRITWTEPLGNIKNARFLNFSYSGEYSSSNSDKKVYDITRGQKSPVISTGNTIASLLTDASFRNYITQNYTSDALTNTTLLSSIINLDLGPEISRSLNEDQSNNFRNKYYNNNIGIGFRQVRTAYNLDVGISLNSAKSSSVDEMNSARNIPSHTVISLAPYARFRYKFSKTRSLAFDYRARSSAPSLTQLQPVADVSNPLNIVVGNPELKPTFTHRVNLRYNDFDQKTQRSIMGMIAVNFERNSIISTTDYDATTGGRTTTYANVNGVWNAFGIGMLSLPLRNKSFYFTSNYSLNFSRTVGYNNGTYNRSQTFSAGINPGIAYRTDIFDIELRPNYRYQTTNNSVQTAANKDIQTYGGQFSANYTAPFGLVFNTDLSYSATSGYASGYNTKQWLWNGSLAYQFLSGKKASIGVTVHDILKQTKNVNRTITANYIEDSYYNSLTRYAMLTFSYRFSTFKKGQEPQNQFGPGEFHRHDGGQRPAGGPPAGGGGRPW